MPIEPFSTIHVAVATLQFKEGKEGSTSFGYALEIVYRTTSQRIKLSKGHRQYVDYK